MHALFNRVSYSTTAVKLVTPSPSPSIKNWRVYQSRFLDPVRINAGVKFWRANQATLQRASEQYGVPPEVIVGIIGVETIYGRYMGNFRALDALTTLTFDYPNTPNRADRQATFRKNLEDLLVWTRDSQIDPTTVLGSYTGAIGIPQFLPSSIVQYAVDYDGNEPHRSAHEPGRCDRQRRELSEASTAGKRAGRWCGRSPATPAARASRKPPPMGSRSRTGRSRNCCKAGMLMNEPGARISRPEAGTPVTVVDLPTPGRADRIHARPEELLRAHAL